MSETEQVNAATDGLLVERSRRGARAAFQEIVARTARLVYARVALDVHDRHRAEDLTQEVFLIAWRSIHTLAEPAALRKWLLAIAASVVADDARRRMRKKRAWPTAELTDVADDSADPIAAAQVSEESRRALEALKGLPEEYRRVLSLRYLAGADYQTISRQLALSNGSLRGLLHRGLELLRKRMTGE